MLTVDIERRIADFQLSPRFEASEELIVLFGPSGCGKSMTLRSIAGLVTPDHGRIQIGGDVVFDSSEGVDLAPQQRGVGYVVQDLALFPHMSARDNIGFALSGLRRDERRKRVNELVTTLGLQGLEDRKPGQLSGGQQQRVALARALAAEPRLLLLDEPFTGLDQGLRAVLRREVVNLRRTMGLTAVFVTHDLSEVYAVAERVVVMDQGTVLQQGSAADVLKAPATSRVAELTDVRNIIPGEVIAFAEGVSTVRTQWFTARVSGSHASGRVFICIRPEHVLLLREGRESHSADDAIVHGEVVEDTALGNTHQLVVRVDPHDLGVGEPLLLHVDVPAHPYDLLGVAARAEWRLILDAAHMTLVPAN
jgi:molybdate transport system ATP-binding protein